MFTSLKKGATAVTAVLALAASVGLAQVNTAAAGAKTKADILIESLGDSTERGVKAKSGSPARAMKIERAGGQVCCYVPGKGLGLVKTQQCRRLKGKIVPLNKCAQAGAKPSEAYFVKVDSETTTEADRPGEPGQTAKRRR